MVDGPVDLGVARRWVGGDRALLLELVGIFVGEAPARLGALRAAVASRDTKVLERLAHSLKGSAGLLGAKGLQGICAELEEVAVGKRLGDAPGLVAQIDSELGRVVTFYRDPAWQDGLTEVEP